MSSAETTHRSYLFAAASSPSVMRKALASDADAVVLDLEDAVAPSHKETARRELAHLLDELSRGPADGHCPAVHVRINRSGESYDVRDIGVAVHPMIEALRLPKAEDAQSMRETSDLVREHEVVRGMEPGTIAFYPTIESARGVLAAGEIASSDRRIARLVVGQADLLADLSSHGDDALGTLVPRSLIVLASRAAGIGAPVDGASIDISDKDILFAELRRARALGFLGKSAIHPRQVAPINSAFTPTDGEVAAARRILAAAESSDNAAATADGVLVDAATVRRANQILQLRGRS